MVLLAELETQGVMARADLLEKLVPEDLLGHEEHLEHLVLRGRGGTVNEDQHVGLGELMEATEKREQVEEMAFLGHLDPV